MKRIISLIMTVVMLFGMMSAMSACGAPKDAGAEVSVYLGGSVFDFDPSEYYVSTDAEQILSLLYEPLFTLKANGKLKLAAAKDYEVDEEERKIIIELRDSYWSDGVQLKASDFVYAWCERIINASVPNPAAALFYDIEGVKEVAMGEGTTSDIGIKATEMKQLVITYCEGADYKAILKNLASIATAPVRQDIVESAESYWSKSANSIVTNGPFKMKRFKADDGEFELARNLGYHQAPTVKDYDNKVNPALIYTVLGDTTVSYADIGSKVFVMTDASLTDRADNAKKAKVADHTSTYTYVFNTNHPLLSDVNARLALSAVIDRQQIVNAITFGKSADGFIPDASCGSSATLISYSADKAKAQSYMSKVDSAVFEANKNITLTINNDPVSIKIAEIVEAAWESLGLVVTVEALGSVENTIKVSNNEEDDIIVVDSAIQTLIKNASYGKVEYDVIAVDWQTYARDAAVGLASFSSKLNGMGVDFVVDENGADKLVNRTNISGWTDAKYDELVDAIYAAKNPTERLAALDAAEAYLAEAMPVCPLVFNQNFVFSGSKVSKIRFDGFGNLVLTDLKLRGYKNYLKPEEEY